MNKLNKKGMDQMVWIAIATVIILAFAVIMFVYVLPKIPKATNSLDDVLKSGDFDGDNKENAYGSDLIDPCPCGTDNVKQRTSSKEYCVAGYTTEECNAANKVANIAYKEETDEKEDLPFFIVNNNKCLYTVEGCKYLKTGDVNFNEHCMAGNCLAAAKTD